MITPSTIDLRNKYQYNFMETIIYILLMPMPKVQIINL